MSEEQLTFRLKAIDDASAAIEKVRQSVLDSQEKTAEGQKKANDKIVGSNTEVVKGFNQLGVAAFTLYDQFDDLEKVKVQADRSNIAVQRSTEAAERAQAAYTAAVEKYGAASPQATQAADALSIAEQQLELNTVKAQIATDNISDAQTRFALSVIPTALSGIDGLTRVQQNWGAVSQVGAAIQGSLGTVMGVLTGQLTLTSVATNIMAAAQGALNAIMSVNPIFLIIAALAALVLAFKWAYDNVEPFRGAVNALADFLRGIFKPIIDIVVGALNWLGGVWSWLTGQTQKETAAQTKAIEDAAVKQLAVVDQKYSDLQKAADDDYKKTIEAASKKWSDQLSTEKTGFDKVVEEYSKYYDQLEGDVNSALDTQLRDISRSYQDQTQAIQTQYDEQLRATTQYWDDQIAAVNEGLSRIKESRDRDLDELELSFLLEKKVTDEAYAAGRLTKEEYEKAIDGIESTYRDTRSKKSDEYRIQELTYERDHEDELKDLESDKKTELTRINEELNAKLKELQDKQATEEETAKRAANLKIQSLETERKTTIDAIKAEEKSLAEEHERKLSELEAAKSAERNAALQKAESDKRALLNTSQAQIAADMEARWRSLKTSLEGIWSGIVSSASSIFNGMKTTLSGIWSGMVSTAQGIWDSITGIFSQSVPAPEYPSPPPTPSYSPEDLSYTYPPDVVVLPNGDYYTPAPPPPTPTPSPTSTSTPSVVTTTSGTVRSYAGGSYDVWQHGFEGIITKPTIALVGEAGPEYVKVTPGASQPKEAEPSILFSPTINVSTGPIFGVAGVREFARLMYDEISKIARSEIKSKTFYLER